MTRAGRRAYASARGKRREWLLENKLPIGLSAAIVATLEVPPVLLLHTHPFLQGVVVGGLAIGAVAIFVSLADRASGSASISMGALTEEHVSQALRRLRRRGWSTFDRVDLPGKRGDVDHVLAGPGGVYCIETKWSIQAWDEKRIAETARRARTTARDLGLLLRSLKLPTDVRAVLVLGGEAGETLDRPVTVDGCWVVPFVDLRAWSAELPVAGGPPRETFAALMAALAAHQRTSERQKADELGLSWVRRRLAMRRGAL